jgi:enterochelin esterase-like enzyme
MMGSSYINREIFLSKILGKKMRIVVYLPQGYSRQNEYQVLYLLHGYSHTEENWLKKIEIDKKADEMIVAEKIKPVIIVMPQIDNSFGINSALQTSVVGGNDPKFNFNFGRYEDYLYQEVIPYIDTHYNTIPYREGRWIGGQSMGGYAALHLAFEHKDMFSKTAGHMPALSLNSFLDSQKNRLYQIEVVRQEWDPINIARNKDLSDIEVYLDCGKNDGYKLFDGCELLYNFLKEKGISVEYHLNSGEHNSAYVKENIEKHLLFYAGKRK